MGRAHHEEEEDLLELMAISAKMLALVQKVEAAREARFAKQRIKWAEERKRMAKAQIAHAKAKKKPPLKKPPLRAR